MNTWMPRRVAVLALTAFAAAACPKPIPSTPLDDLSRKTNIARVASSKVCSRCATLSGSSTIDDLLACQNASNESNKKVRDVERALARLGNEQIPDQTGRQIANDLKDIDDCLTKGRQAFENAIKEMNEDKKKWLRLLQMWNDLANRLSDMLRDWNEKLQR